MSKVYARVDENGYITAVEGGYTTPKDLTGWVPVDEGEGDRYNLCQSNYFPGPLITDGGAYRYRLVEGQPVECTPEEIAAQEEALKPAPTPTLESRVEVLESTTDDMILLMADLIGGEEA